MPKIHINNIISKLFFAIFIIIVSLFSFFCDNSVIHNPINTDKLPMWPEYGYNGRRTGNPYKIQNIEPVNGANTVWYDTLMYGHNKITPTVDSKGNIYYLMVHNNYLNATLYKINSEGKIVWTFFDATLVPSFGNGMALSKDEKNIYIPCFTGLYCVDSSGILKWVVPNGSAYSNVTMPAIGEDGTIYSIIGAYYLTAVSPEGKFLWDYHGAMGAPSLDKDGNIYVGLTDGQIGGHNNGIGKFDKNGVKIWSYNLLTTPLGIVIDANNNIYTQIGNSFNTGLYSFSKNGELRWSKLLHLGDTIAFNYTSTPLISKNNMLYVSGGWVKNDPPYVHGIINMDTSGNIKSKKELNGGDSLYDFLYDLFFDANQNIYYISISKYGSIDINLNDRFYKNEFITNLIIGDKNLFCTKTDANSITTMHCLK